MDHEVDRSGQRNGGKKGNEYHNMTIFVIIQQHVDTPNRLAAAIKAAYPNDTYALEGNAWLISDNSTAVDVSNRIGITDGEAGSAVVIEAASYYGRANPAIWSWIKAKWEGGPNG